MKYLLVLFLTCFSILSKVTQINAQVPGKEVSYTIVAQGFNSPLNDVSVVCYNKYYNLDMLPEKFRSDNNLEDKPYKKMMLIQIFLGERTKDVNHIKITSLTETEAEITLEYDTAIEESTDTTAKQNPYIILQIQKSKKPVSFIENGVHRGSTGTRIYMNN